MNDYPQAVTSFFEALNAQDTNRALTVFTADAVVTDDGQTLQGHDEIGPWIDKDIVGVQVTLTPTSITREAGQTVVEARGDGSFPGSPLTFVFRFQPSDADFRLIAGLNISLAA
ncbi:nuclear transport factor 2 family protein [Actinoplanes bogorensis]|uniref:Nuclear transport factor 2 family protein n=1 Tax=Paractinoplanes bogorensis TaxID=1610840 RepID=A0ABS5YRK7_9ACTN|nr:nuclear transport factor 2 family protein [Actinoplanes bogorensis]MBU2666071.1 nuclear transport factor 2 family protein [Actinoplanes bogorensis]